MELKMILIDALALNVAIQRLQGDGQPRPVKFGYALAINSRKLKDVIDSFEESRQVLLNKFGKHTNGELVVENSNVVLEDQAGFNRAFADLHNTEVALELHKVKIDDLPAELDAAIVNALFPMII
jgi:hypothetical protein